MKILRNLPIKWIIPHPLSRLQRYFSSNKINDNITINVLNTWLRPDPPENCNLNVKKIAKNLTFKKN